METHELPRTGSLELVSVELTVAEGPDRGKRFAAGPTARLGTAPGCHIHLTDPTVSRLHCEVQVQPDGVRLVDTSSRNGTWVDGVRIRDAYLADGCTIRMGSTALRAQFGVETFRVPLSDRDHFGAVLGTSVEMRRLYTILERVAPTEATVLIMGETGTGKELFARAVHDASLRKAAPFVAIDCGAIAENLIESELFGHAKGAFSGAIGERQGLFEEARGGTVFLDEIGELPLSLQPKLLRVLESREVRRVGENAMRPVDVRVVAATNRALAQAVNKGTFREDLYYRLAVVELKLPPLRARRGDTVLLAKHFLRRFGVDDPNLPPDLIAALLNRSWPGNVRELRNYIENRVSFGMEAAPPSLAARAAQRALPSALEPLVPSDLPLKEAKEAWMEAFERAYLAAVLKKSNGNVSKAAEIAGVNRRLLYRIMDRLGIEGRDAEDGSSGDGTE